MWAYEVPVTPDAIRVPAAGAKPDVEDAYTLYLTPGVALAVQLKLIRFAD